LILGEHPPLIPKVVLIFIPDGGAFYVTYVITGAFIGAAVKLLQITENLIFFVKICICYASAYKNKNNLSWMLLITFTPLAPVITLWGLLLWH
jgi:hypothetical protein